MSDESYNEAQLASIWNFKFKNAMVQKADYTKRWQMYIDAYKGDYFKNTNLPDYRSNLVSNYIFSIVETIRPIMLENNPKFQSMPRKSEGMKWSNDLHDALTYEWDRERMKRKISRELINTLVLGTSVFFIPWDSKEKNTKAIPVNPFNIFPDPLATCVDDAEHIIYASYKNVELLKRLFPEKADELFGSSINYSELVQDNDKNAHIDNQVLVLEVWTKDYETEELDAGENKHIKPKYPNGRVITICPELGKVLNDKAAPYKDNGRLPFVLIKDYDIPDKFWGEGEVAQLLSPQKHMNDLNNAILDNAKASANMPWIVDKNAGIGYGKITARPGIVIRKNPGSEVKRDQPPSMPMYVVNAVETYKNDIEQISGIHNSLRGESATGVYTAQGILALQEAGQVRIRLKVDLFEDSCGEIAQLFYSRMKQYWGDDRWIRIAKPDGTYDMKKFTKSILEHDYDIKVTAGSTMPVNRGAMLDLMIRLAQTPMPDGENLVDRESVVEYLPQEVRAPLLRRMQEKQAHMAEIQEAIEQLGEALKQLASESTQNDEQTFKVIEEITGTIEQLSQQILQLQEEHDKMEEEQKEQEKEDAIKKEAYNKGYSDAETVYSEEDRVGVGLEEQEGLEDVDAVPDDVLAELEGLSDEELKELLEQYPNLADLIK